MVVLKRTATMAEAKGQYWSDVMSAGSFPAFVTWVTAAVQCVMLLSVSSLADYGEHKKSMLRRCTLLGSLLVACTIFLVDGSLWWLAGLLRLLIANMYVLSFACYNAFLPMIAASHYQVLPLDGHERSDRQAQVTDEMSSNGHAIGAMGGLVMLVVAWVIQKVSMCAEDGCS